MKIPASNPLNLPYSDSESETKQEEEIETQKTNEMEEQYVDLPTPTPPEEQELTEAKQPENTPSTSQSSKVNQLLRELYNLKHAEKQVNLKNAELIKRNVNLYDRNQEVKQKYEKTLERNKMLMKDNVSLYRKIRILRLQLKEFQIPQTKPSGLETLAEIAESMEQRTEIHQQEMPKPVERRRSTRKKT